MTAFAPSNELDGPSSPNDMADDLDGTSYCEYARIITILHETAKIFNVMLTYIDRYLVSSRAHGGRRGCLPPRPAFQMAEPTHKSSTSGPGVKRKRPIVWNGQVDQFSCIKDHDDISIWDIGDSCPTIHENLDRVSEDAGEPIRPCGPNAWPRQQVQVAGGGSTDADGCPAVPGDGPGQNIDWSTGPKGMPVTTSE